MNLQPRRPPGRADEPFRHLIDEYKHQTQTVTCTCGWQGSSASPDGRTSDWKDHLAATRTSASGPVTKTSATAPKAVPVVRPRAASVQAQRAPAEQVGAGATVKAGR